MQFRARLFDVHLQYLLHACHYRFYVMLVETGSLEEACVDYFRQLPHTLKLHLVAL